MIVNTIPANERPPPPLSVKLPTLDELPHVITMAKINNQDLFFTEINISNMLWKCKLPHSYKHSVHIGVHGRVFSFPSLPFGCKTMDVYLLWSIM